MDQILLFVYFYPYLQPVHFVYLYLLKCLVRIYVRDTRHDDDVHNILDTDWDTLTGSLTEWRRSYVIFVFV
jgi:hypothetical protein